MVLLSSNPSPKGQVIVVVVKSNSYGGITTYICCQRGTVSGCSRNDRHGSTTITKQEFAAVFTVDLITTRHVSGPGEIEIRLTRCTGVANLQEGRDGIEFAGKTIVAADIIVISATPDDIVTATTGQCVVAHTTINIIGSGTPIHVIGVAAAVEPVCTIAAAKRVISIRDMPVPRQTKKYLWCDQRRVIPGRIIQLCCREIGWQIKLVGSRLTFTDSEINLP